NVAARLARMPRRTPHPRRDARVAPRRATARRGPAGGTVVRGARPDRRTAGPHLLVTPLPRRGGGSGGVARGIGRGRRGGCVRGGAAAGAVSGHPRLRGGAAVQPAATGRGNAVAVGDHGTAEPGVPFAAVPARRRAVSELPAERLPPRLAGARPVRRP